VIQFLGNILLAIVVFVITVLVIFYIVIVEMLLGYGQPKRFYKKRRKQSRLRS